MQLEEKTDAELEARLAEINRPSEWLAGKSGQPPSLRFAEAKTKREAWDAAHPELAAERLAILGELERRAARQREARERELEESRICALLEESGVGPRALEAFRKGPQPTEAIRAVEEFLLSKKTFLLLSGPPGVGKTVASIAAMQWAAEWHQRPVFVRAVDCNKRPMFDAETRAFFGQMRTASMLVVDDLGVEQVNDSWREAFDDVVDTRYQEHLRTVLTTNLPPAAEKDKPSFRQRYGERVADRIREDGQIAQCGRDSMRPKARTG